MPTSLVNLQAFEDLSFDGCEVHFSNADEPKNIVREHDGLHAPTPE
jgi:hypothetical protein